MARCINTRPMVKLSKNMVYSPQPIKLQSRAADLKDRWQTCITDTTPSSSTASQMDRTQISRKASSGKGEPSKQKPTPAPAQHPRGSTLQPSSQVHAKGHGRHDSNSTNWSVQTARQRTPEPTNPAVGQKHRDSPGNHDRDLQGCGSWHSSTNGTR